MIFTRLGILVAWVLAILAATRFGTGIYAMTLPAEEMRKFASLYLGTTNPGPATDQAALAFAIAIALGIFAEISRSLARRNVREDTQPASQNADVTHHSP
jgi:hypothetical protein